MKQSNHWLSSQLCTGGKKKLLQCEQMFQEVARASSRRWEVFSVTQDERGWQSLCGRSQLHVYFLLLAKTDVLKRMEKKLIKRDTRMTSNAVGRFINHANKHVSVPLSALPTGQPEAQSGLIKAANELL